MLFAGDVCMQADGPSGRLLLNQALPELDNFVEAAFREQAAQPGLLEQVQVGNAFCLNHPLAPHWNPQPPQQGL